MLQVWKTPALTKTGWRSPASASRRASTSDPALSPRRTADEVAAEVSGRAVQMGAVCGCNSRWMPSGSAAEGSPMTKARVPLLEPPEFVCCLPAPSHPILSSLLQVEHPWALLQGSLTLLQHLLPSLASGLSLNTHVGTLLLT